MMTTVLTGIMFMLYFGSAQALNCYFCASVQTPNGCGVDNFNPKATGMLVQSQTEYNPEKFDCSSCAVMISKTAQGDVVTRSCYPMPNTKCVSGKQTVGNTEVDITCCNTDLCNGVVGKPTTAPTSSSSSLMSTSFVIAVMVVMAAILRWIATVHDHADERFWTFPFCNVVLLFAISHCLASYFL